MKALWLVSLLLLPASVFAQSSVPNGTLLPVMLNTGLNADHLHAGARIRATVMQDIPGTSIHRGAKLLGHVIRAKPTELDLQFDSLRSHGQDIDVTTDLRALASMLEVEESRIPEGGADRTLPPDLRNSEQIGGEEVYKQGGPVTRGDAVVAQPTAYGIVGKPQSDGPCRGEVDTSAPQAFWRFSTNACGLYGYHDLTIAHAGRTAPLGTIELTAKSGRIHIHSGSGWLLRVVGS